MKCAVSSRWAVVTLLLWSAAGAQAQAPAPAPAAPAAPATTESMTVVRQGADGEIQVQQKTVVGEVGDPTLRKTVPRPPAPAEAANDSARKARIVVIPAIMGQEQRRRIDRVLNQRWGFTDPGVFENPGYTSYLIDSLVNTRKFDVLEREELQSITHELDFGESDFVDPAKAQRIGNMTGADYIIIPIIQDLRFDEITKNVPYIGGQQTTVEVGVRTAVRTVDASTGKVVSSYMRDVEKKGRVRQGANKQTMVKELTADAFSESGLLNAAMIVDVAYPIRVMSVAGDYVMLNRGRGAINKDEVLNVFATGEIMVDPDTGENLGYQEIIVGRVKVESVEPKTSQALILEGKGQIQKLSICRREELPTAGTAVPAQAPAPRID